MIFKNYSNLEGRHAFMSPSKYHWIYYNDDKFVDAYRKHLAAIRGTKLHAFAANAISLGQKLEQNGHTLNMYINDAIGYKMTPEQPLYFSENCFGTTDAISFRNNLLRVHDLKTGETPAHMEQLYVYAALFCLDYGIRPASIDIETRIYQSNEVLVDNPTVEDILPIIDRIVSGDKLTRELTNEEDN